MKNLALNQVFFFFLFLILTSRPRQILFFLNNRSFLPFHFPSASEALESFKLMSLELGYTSESDCEHENENEVIKENKEVTQPSVITLATPKVKSLSGTFQEEVISTRKFELNRRKFFNGTGIGGIDGRKRKLSNDVDLATSKDKLPESKRKAKGDVSVLEGQDKFVGSWGTDESSENESEGDCTAKLESENMNLALPEETPEQFTEFTESSTFYGGIPIKSSIFDLPQDYQIRFATTVPGQKEYYVPKKVASSFKAHKSTVTSLQFFPNMGHLILSSGSDGIIKLWSTTKQKLIRDYVAHAKAVKYVSFSEDGHYFISCSYDKTIKIWETETGNMRYKHKVKSNPNMCTFVPGKEHEFMAALDNCTVVHVNWHTGELVQLYEHHERPVLWIEFINNGTQFVTSSDDRTLKIWDLQINMPIKYIADPRQHAMPVVKAHPTFPFFVGQSMDNQVLVYSARQKDKFKKNNNKSFKGHNTAGYSIRLGFTPDGKTLMSGDSTGYCYFWDWKTCKLVKKIKVANNVLTNIDVHPLETSMVVLAGYDGDIYILN